MPASDPEFSTSYATAVQPDFKTRFMGRCRSSTTTKIQISEEPHIKLWPHTKEQANGIFYE